MKLRNILIVVKDIERARKYYHDLFGLDILLLCYSICQKLISHFQKYIVQ